MTRTAIVVGGGIAGLACAVALGRRGWAVEVLERNRFGESGAGITLWPNALRALDAIGLGDAVRAEALVETEAGIRRPSGRWLSRTDTAELQRRYGPVVVLHRARLHDILREAVPAPALRAGVPVDGAHSTSTSASVLHSGERSSADLVVGADGIAGAVRRSVWPAAPPPYYAGYTAWRTIAEAGIPVAAGGETWGRGERFGIVPLADGRVYCFAAASVPAGERSADGELAELRRRFGRWHDPIPALLDAMDEGAILRNDIVELPPLDAYASDRVALVGDAAHAMPPDLGQGACQALEDAVSLAAQLDAAADVPAALAAYDAERRPRTQAIAERSRRIGSIAQWRSAPAVALRDALVRLTPSRVVTRSFEPVLSWTAPRDAAGPRRPWHATASRARQCEDQPGRTSPDS